MSENLFSESDSGKAKNFKVARPVTRRALILNLYAGGSTCQTPTGARIGARNVSCHSGFAGFATLFITLLNTCQLIRARRPENLGEAKEHTFFFDRVYGPDSSQV